MGSEPGIRAFGSDPDIRMSVCLQSNLDADIRVSWLDLDLNMDIRVFESDPDNRMSVCLQSNLDPFIRVSWLDLDIRVFWLRQDIRLL